MKEETPYQRLGRLAKSIPGFCLHAFAPESAATCKSHYVCQACDYPIQHKDRSDHDQWHERQLAMTGVLAALEHAISSEPQGPEVAQRDAEALVPPAQSPPIE